jgi:hypothetical protein
MIKQRIFSSVGLAFALGACSGQTPAPKVATHYSPARVLPSAQYAGLAGPASVLYDAEADRYLVANVNGGAVARDGNGFISVLAPDGRVLIEKWIAGGERGAKLDAPKGLAISQGILYVADISVVRTFDLKSGEPRGDVEVSGSTYLKDLANGPDGALYLSDAGAPTGRFDAKGTEAVYAIEHGHAKLLAKGPLGRPDGLVWSDKGLVVCPFGANEVYRVDERGAKQDVTKTPAGGLSGLVRLPDDSLLVASWQASSIFRGTLGGHFEAVLENQGSPSDIGYDTKRSRLLVPHYVEGTVEAFELQ